MDLSRFGNLPKVSIVLTTCNREYFFSQSLESILEQDYPNLEVIISDDNSTDGTFIQANEYAKEYPFIKVVRNTHTSGSAGNRNNGLDYVTGDLALLLDDDDILFKEAISQMVEIYLEQNKKYGIIVANCTRSDDGSLSGKGVEESREVTFEEVLSGKLQGEFITLFEYKLLGNRRFNEDVKRGNIGLLWLRIHKKNPCYYLHRPLKFYRIHAESLTNRVKYDPLEMVKNYEQDILLFYRERRKFCPKYLAELCATAGVLYNKGGEKKKAWRKFIQSFAIAPNFFAIRGILSLALPSFLPTISVRKRVEK